VIVQWSCPALCRNKPGDDDLTSAPSAMNILMPQLGETAAEGKITQWFKATGDAVKPGDNLFEIETR
jgi:hypothetical protein